MSEGHLLKPTIARSKRWRRTDGQDFDRWVYTLLIACVDSWGMMPADGITLKAHLDPHGLAHPAEDFAQAVKRLHCRGLVATFADQGAFWLYLVGHDEQQSRGIRNRKKNPDVQRPAWVLHWEGCDQDPTRCDQDPTTCAYRSARAEVEVETKRNEVETKGKGNGEGKTDRATSPLAACGAAAPLALPSRIDACLREIGPRPDETNQDETRAWIRRQAKWAKEHPESEPAPAGEGGR